MNKKQRDAIRARVEAVMPLEGLAVVCPFDEDGSLRWGIEDGHGLLVAATIGRKLAELFAHAPADILALLDALDAAQDELAQAREGLRKYGGHRHACRIAFSEPCTCGYETHPGVIAAKEEK
jgi:hypothetical protein